MRPAWAIARPAARRKREQRRPEAIRGGVFASGRVGFVPSQTARFGQSREGRILRCWGCPPPRGGVARGNPPWQVGRNAANLLCAGGGLADAMPPPARFQPPDGGHLLHRAKSIRRDPPAFHIGAPEGRPGRRLRPKFSPAPPAKRQDKPPPLAAKGALGGIGLYCASAALSACTAGTASSR